ncbi:hypothetical protein GCM10011531_28110 [Aquaticitalea lipolytica]|uniref:Uncharacterized protein n=1 Tax=Aquaticitalea lipolytica TaxID=1247562 RepID=A0A8J2XAT6_9FLAO|nr:hypothetical protein [Aquaticitalea lipolytica]GFZ94785.1 hypothetical protein GCM10011531_28110 [Aquaticitalea lipolytica]
MNKDISKSSITNRSNLNIIEIIIIPIVSLLIIGLLVNWIVGIVIALLNLLLYPLIRFSTWVFYKEVRLCHNELFVLNKFLNKSLSCKLITNDFNKKKLFIKEHKAGSKTNYILQYKTHKIIDLLILEDKNDIIRILGNEGNG